MGECISEVRFADYALGELLESSKEMSFCLRAGLNDLLSPQIL